MKKIKIFTMLALAALLLGGAARELPLVSESPEYEAPEITAPESTPESTPEPTPARESRPNHEGFVSSLDSRIEVEGERPWFYDESRSREENILSYLTEEAGLNRAAACGIIASMDVETGGTFDPGAENPISYGLCQWLGGRLENLKSWCSENGEDYTTIPGQLAFLVWEMQNADPYGTWDYLCGVEDSAEGAYSAGRYFCYWFERPLELQGQSNYRAYLAAQHYGELE